MPNTSQDLEGALASALIELDAAKKTIARLRSRAHLNEPLAASGSTEMTADISPASRLAKTKHTRTNLDERAWITKTEGAPHPLDRRAIEVSGLGGWRFDLASGNVKVTPIAAALLGVPLVRSLSLDEVFSFYKEKSAARLQAALDRALETGDAIDEILTLITKQHRERTVRVIGHVEFEESGEISGLAGSVQDITPIDNSESLAREAERLQKFAMYLAKIGSWHVDLVKMSITWSDEVSAIHDEPAGTSPSLDSAIGYYVPEHRDLIRARFSACADDGHPYSEVLQIITAKGRRIWVRMIAEAVRDASGTIIAVEGALQDYSEQVAAREESDALGGRLLQTLEDISDGFILLDQDMNFVFVNGKAEILLQRSRHSLLGRHIWTEYPEAAGSGFQTAYEQALTTNQSVEYTAYFEPLDMWIDVKAHPTPEGIAVYFRDVTTQNLREEQLRLLETAVSVQSDILLITEVDRGGETPENKIVYVNNAFERQTGYSREEVIGKDPRFLQGPNTQRSELDRIRDKMAKHEPVRAEIINYTKSNHEYWLELDLVPLFNDAGNLTHWVAVERDITDRKLAERGLQTNENRFRFISKATGIAIWDWDVQSDKLWWSDGLKDIFGHEPIAADGTPTIWSANLHPEDEIRVADALEQMRAGHLDKMQENFRFRRSDGSWAKVEGRAFVMRDDTGEVNHVLGSMVDISERLALEERLHQAQKMEAVGQLTGGVAHDFNNLLTVMMGNSELLMAALDGQPRLQRLAEMTLSAADSGAEMTSRLLSFSRKQPLEPKVLDVGPLVQGMDGLLRRTLPENIDIEVIRGGGLWKTEVDQGQLEAALLNLALNARDAMIDGGSMTIEMANTALDDDYVSKEYDVKAGQYVLIAVTDTGHGIPSDIVDRIFEPFFTTKEAGKGSGLGLSMIYGFVKQSGGHLKVYSEEGEGTTVKMYFPKSTIRDEEIYFDQVTSKVKGGSETILVVEDDMLVREHVKTQLKGLGYIVIDAPTGLEAIELLNQRPEIGLLFTDVVMPGGMGGRELADVAHAYRPDLKVLFTSGYTENSIVHNGKLNPGVDLLSKPYRRDQLANKVRKVLDR